MFLRTISEKNTTISTREKIVCFRLVGKRQSHNTTSCLTSKSKFMPFFAVATVIVLFLIAIPVVYSQQTINGTKAVNGMYLFPAGGDSGTCNFPTGAPGAEPTDDIISTAIDYGLLLYMGDQQAEVVSFDYGLPEPPSADTDTTLGEVVTGLTKIDDFGRITEGGDDAANFDTGRGGSFEGLLRDSNGSALIITPDGIVATGSLGPSDAGNTSAAEDALQGFEIFIFEDAELSGMTITLSSLTNNISIVLADRQINSNTTGGADDTLIAIDLDSLDGTAPSFQPFRSLTMAPRCRVLPVPGLVIPAWKLMR